jgi:putative sigma-54 modulation protein
MRLNLSGHHVEITPALRDYAEKKIARVVRHCDRFIDAQCTLTVEKKLRHQAECTLRIARASIHAVAVHDDMYAAIDALADKLDEQVRRHKERSRDPKAARHRHGVGVELAS